MILKTTILALALPLLAGISTASFAANKASDVYAKNCASCHGATLAGGMAGSLLDDKWLTDGSEASLTQKIKQGATTLGMPAWAGTLSDQEIRSLVIYIGEQRAKAARAASPVDTSAKVVSAQGHTFSIETIHVADSILWAVEYLPDGTMLATQRDGELLHIDRNGKLIAKIQDLPDIWHHVQGGFLDITLHPDYSKNGWIYIAYATSSNGKTGATKIARGKIKKGRWVKHQDIFEPDSAAHTNSGRHFGSRIVLQDGYVYFAFGDRGDRPTAQDMSVPNGKVFRLYDNGKLPKDNPFIKDKKALPGIWSLGHRNPQGLAVEPATGLIWEAEHGPRGGDEINVLEGGKNYGWPIITYGMNYNGTPITHLTEKAGMEQPKYYWVPSIAVAGITFYNGDMFPKWQGKLLAGGMGIQELQMFTATKGELTNKQIVLADRGRIRDVSIAPDGAIHLVVTKQGKGHILRLASTDK